MSRPFSNVAFVKPFIITKNVRILQTISLVDSGDETDVNEELTPIQRRPPIDISDDSDDSDDSEASDDSSTNTQSSYSYTVNGIVVTALNARNDFR